MKSGAVIITGIPQIDRRLKRLPRITQGKVIRRAMRDGMYIVAAKTRQEVPVASGLTKDNVKVRASKKKRRGDIEIEVKIGGDPGLYRTSAKTGEKVFYPAIVEYKHNHFMHRAFEATKEIARQRAIEGILIGIEREASKA